MIDVVVLSNEGINFAPLSRTSSDWHCHYRNCNWRNFIENLICNYYIPREQTAMCLSLQRLWLIQTELDRDRDRDQEKNGLHYFMFDIHTATYLGTYTLALYSPGPGPVQALSEWAISVKSENEQIHQITKVLSPINDVKYWKMNLKCQKRFKELY